MLKGAYECTLQVPRDKLPQKIYETFTKMDLDVSGHLTREEVGAAFEKLGKPLLGDELDKWMESVDVDGIGEGSGRWRGGGKDRKGV